MWLSRILLRVQSGDHGDIANHEDHTHSSEGRMK